MIDRINYKLSLLKISIAHASNKKLLDYFPNLVAHADGRGVILTFRDDVGSAVAKAITADAQEDALHLAKAVEIVR